MSTSTCTQCGYANREGVRFCEGCGVPLATRCPACAAELPEAARFCGECGAAVAADAVQLPDGSLKVVSVVFSDLVGSTALQESLDAESVRRVMERFYGAMRGVVARHEGSLEKFIGDAVVAVFGTPMVREDDALRAVQCAGEMVASLNELNHQLERAWGVRLAMRTGVNTGELVVNEEGILVGDTMNTAARLEQAAGAGEVLVGEATWRLVRHRVSLEETAPLELKGKAQPVRAWRLESLEQAQAAHAEAPFVGRGGELERLRVAFGTAVSRRACRLVSVVGSPGLGKSRLAAEFATSVAAEASVLTGHCEPSGEGITFLPVAEVLREAAGIAEADSSSDVVEKLTAVVAEGPERERIVARAAALLGVGEPAAPEETFWAVRSVLESLAARRPLVLVLDDVHWGQPMFLDLIEHLVEWARDAPVLLIALARPELREIREVLASAGRRALDVIELEPLEPGESRQLVSGLLGEVALADSLVERLLSTTEGNPLFLSELMRMLVDEGALVREGAGWIAAGGEDAVQVPPTIQALLTARIERLRADERSVVERAAVIGKQFYRGAVAQLVAPPVRVGIDGHLETLRRKDMVEPEGTYWIDEPVYRFHHVLIRDAAYHLLLKEARAELHEKFADWLAAKAGELVGEHEEVIAYHLEQAHQYRRMLGPLDERGLGLGARAAGLLASAGRRALAREDLAAAANLLQRALDCEPGEGQADVVWDLAEALLSARDTARAAQALTRLGSGVRADVLGAQLDMLTGEGSLEGVLGRIVAATEELGEAGDAVGEAKAWHVTAQVQAQLGRVGDVESSLDRALLAARRAEDRRRITAVLAAAPRAALWGPSPVVRASGRCLDVVRILRMTPGNRHVEAVALRCQAVLEAMRGRFDAAREILAAGRVTLEELGLTWELHELAVHAGIVELLAGEAVAASERLASARDGFLQLGVSTSAGQAASLLARALVEQGRNEEAVSETRFAEEHAGGDLKTTITWLGVRGEALAAAEDSWEDAVTLARRAVELAESTDALADKADAYMALARVLRVAARDDEARAAASSARELYVEKDHAVGVRRAEELAGGARPELVARPTADSAVIENAEVAALFAQLGAAWQARDIDRLLALHAEDYVMIDHRELGWGEFSGLDAQRNWYRTALDASPDLGLSMDEVLASDRRVVAVRGTWRGHSSETGGLLEIPMTRVIAIREGKITRLEIFDPDADASALACFADLQGRGLLGDRPSERLQLRWIDCFGRRDEAGLLELIGDEYRLVEHRSLGWEGQQGWEDFITVARSAWKTWPDIRIVLDEVIACDERVAALRTTYRGAAVDGGGAMELAVGYVSSFGDSGFREVHQFDHDDREGMLECYRALGGTFSVLGDRPPERLLARRLEAWNARDRATLTDTYADDAVLVDHRQMGWEPAEGPEAIAAVAASSWEHMSSDLRLSVEAVLACDDSVIATVVCYRGTGDEGGGDLELRLGQVAVVDDGRIVRGEMFDPDDRQAMIARYVELGGGLAPLREWPLGPFMAEYARLHATRDIERFMRLHTEDCVLIDYRAVGWEELRGRDALEQMYRSGLAIAADLRFEVDDVLACDERMIVMRSAWRGHAADGGGEFSYALIGVCVVEDGRMSSMDMYDYDDAAGALARYAELGGGREVVLPPERLHAEFQRRVAAHEPDGVAALYAEDCVMTDHRTIGLDAFRGREGARALYASHFDMFPDARFEQHEVLACDERVMAEIGTWEGVTDAGSEAAQDFGIVYAVEDGRFAAVDLYPPDDRRAMIARYAELGGGLHALGDRPPERWWREYAQRYAARDRDAVVAMHADGTFVDHRRLGWESTPTVEGVMAIIDGAWAATTDIRIEVDEVLASDERVCALRIAWRGSASDYSAKWEIPMGIVAVVEDGRSTHYEQFEPEDTEAMLARFAELGRGSAGLGDSPIERFVAATTRAYNEHDLQAHAAQHADDFVLIDHRSLGWEEVRGREAMAKLIGSPSSTVRMDLEEVLACDGERRIAFRGAWRSEGSATAGPWEVPIGFVTVVEGERIVSHDLYEHEDVEAMLARYEELGRPEAEQSLNEYLRCWNDHDAEAAAQCLAEDWVLADHRGLGVWDELQGRAAWEGAFRSIFARAGREQRLELQEVMASDSEVIACLVSFTGTGHRVGDWDLPMGWVARFQQSRFQSLDMYDLDDRQDMLARYAELGGGQGRLGDRPSERWWAEVMRAYARGDLGALAGRYSEEWKYSDRRQLGWEMHGRDGAAEFWRSALAASSAQHGEVDAVLACDDRVIATQLTWHGTAAEGGGEFAIALGNVSVIEDGLCVLTEQYDHDDTDALLARFAELSHARASVLPDVIARSDAAFNRHDPELIAATYAEDIVFIDHRSLSWEPLQGREAVAELADSAWKHMSPDVQTTCESVLASDGRVVARQVAFRGAGAVGGGAAELMVGMVCTIRDDLIDRIEFFAPEDRLAMIARYAELEGGLGPLGERPPELQVKEYARGIAARDLTRLAALHGDDWVLVDHRNLGWEEIRGVDAALELVRSGFALMADVRLEVYDVLAADDRVIALRASWCGAANDGGGAMEIPLGIVIVVESGRAIRHEQFDADDRDAMLARFNQLSGGSAEPQELHRRFDLLYNQRRLRHG